ncbi:MAG: FadR/GntR family transcriptional regulator [Christensenellales bacterium]|jgi:GntR family transcriptional repressor for pyruvate dehydrogenase complex
MSRQSKKKERESASASVANVLRNAIASSEFGPGDKIPSETILSNQFRVSRVTVRAATHLLKGEDLLESRQGGGTYVRDSSAVAYLQGTLKTFNGHQPDRIDMFEFRRIMEIESAGLAALRANAEMVTRMDETTRRMREATEPEEIAKWDLSFHRLVAEATDNIYILQVFDSLKNNYLTMLSQNVRIMGSNGARFHELICRAIEIRDDEMAKSYMREHLTDTIRSTMTKMRELAISETKSIIQIDSMP